jgi:hypothetical protein
MSVNRTVASTRSTFSAASSDRICSFVHAYDSTYGLVGSSRAGSYDSRTIPDANARVSLSRMWVIDAFERKALATAQDNRVDRDPVLVDQAVVHQRIDQVGAAGDQDVPARLVLQPPDLVCDVAAEERRVLPRKLLETLRDDASEGR